MTTHADRTTPSGGPGRREAPRPEATRPDATRPDATRPDAIRRDQGRPWWGDPLEVDRTLEGQVEPGVRLVRERDLAGDPALAEVLAGRRAFLEGLAAAGARWRARAVDVPPGLAARVRDACRTQRTRRRFARRWAVAAAAVALAAVGSALLRDDGPEAQAMPVEVVKAADVARTVEQGPRACLDGSATNPAHFPPVRQGVFKIWGCLEDGARTVARLYRPEELPSVGYAAVAESGVSRGPDIGRTDLGDVVVYDLLYGSKRHFLAVSRDWLERQRAMAPGRESCRACHHLSRVGQPNPHDIVERAWAIPPGS